MSKFQIIRLIMIITLIVGLKSGCCEIDDECIVSWTDCNDEEIEF